MAREIFVDTSGFYAILVGRDDMHERAARILRQAESRKAPFVTTDYVLDDTAWRMVEPFVKSTLASKACAVEWTGPEDFAKAVTFRSKHIDQNWSFTDCVSFQTMRARRLTDALTKDQHFERAGFKALLR